MLRITISLVITDTQVLFFVLQTNDRMGLPYRKLKIPFMSTYCLWAHFLQLVYWKCTKKHANFIHIIYYLINNASFFVKEKQKIISDVYGYIKLCTIIQKFSVNFVCLVLQHTTDYWCCRTFLRNITLKLQYKKAMLSQRWPRDAPYNLPSALKVFGNGESLSL